MINKLVKKYFSFEDDFFFEPKDICSYLNEDFVIEGERLLLEREMDVSNIYFKLIGQMHYMKEQALDDKNALAQLHYIIAYYVGLFLHPFCGEKIAISHIERAIKIQSDSREIKKYNELIDMIKQ